MGSPDPMAIKTVLRDRQSNLHSAGAGLRVTRTTIQQGIRASLPDHRVRMTTMGESQVGCRRSSRRCPADRLLDNAVVAVGTSDHGRPEGSSTILHARVTTGAGGKEPPVLFVIEAIPPLSVARLNQQDDEHQRRGKRPSGGHDPVRLRVRSARGRGEWSAPLPNSSVTRAFSRV